jgi:single-strand DNA-binding protein
MSDLAQITVSGRVGRDPEHKQVGAKGTDLAKTSLAVSPDFKDDDYTDWYTLNFWGGRGAIARHISKGDKLVVTGSLQIRTYEKKDGGTGVDPTIDVNDVVFMSGGSGGRKKSSRPPAEDSSEDLSNESLEQAMNDDLPF